MTGTRAQRPSRPRGAIWGVAAVVAAGCSGCGVPPFSVQDLTASSGPPALQDALVAGPFPVTRVVDGDTLWVERAGQRVKLRLIGVDAPETRDPGEAVECFGPEATARAEELLTGLAVALESDPSQGVVDRYGRELVYVWLPDGQMLNLLLLEEGFAYEYTYDRAYRHQAAFAAAEQRARSAEAGMWADGTCA